MESFSARIWRDATEPLNVYAIVDGSRDDTLGVSLDAKARRTQTLASSGRNGPILAQVRRDETVLDWLFAEGHDQRWFIIIVSSNTFEEVAAHTKCFTRIDLYDGRRVSFRFYDPMIFVNQMRAFSLEQRKLFFSIFERVYAGLGDYLFRLVHQADGRIAWSLSRDCREVDEPSSGVWSLPNLDLTGSSASPRFALSKQQYEVPVLMNVPFLVEELETSLREDFAWRMRAYPPGIVRAMIEQGALTAIGEYQIADLDCVYKFVDLQWRVAPGFHEEPEVHAILADVAKTPAERFDQLAADESNEALVRSFDYDDSKYWKLPL